MEKWRGKGRRGEGQGHTGRCISCFIFYSLKQRQNLSESANLKHEVVTAEYFTSSVSNLAVPELGLESNLRLEAAPSNPLSRGLSPLPAA